MTETLFSQIMDELEQQYLRGKDLLSLLIDVSELTYLPTKEQRKRIVEAMKISKNIIIKEAVYGTNFTLVTMLADLLLVLSGRKNIRIFRAREEAVRWLRQ